MPMKGRAASDALKQYPNNAPTSCVQAMRMVTITATRRSTPMQTMRTMTTAPHAHMRCAGFSVWEKAFVRCPCDVRPIANRRVLTCSRSLSLSTPYLNALLQAQAAVMDRHHTSLSPHAAQSHGHVHQQHQPSQHAQTTFTSTAPSQRLLSWFATTSLSHTLYRAAHSTITSHSAQCAVMHSGHTSVLIYYAGP